MTRFFVALLLAWGLVATTIDSAFAQAEVEPPPAYNQLVAEAVSEFDAGHWAEALAIFLRAHATFPNARTLRGIGMTSFELRDYPTAMRALSDSLADTRRALTTDQRRQVAELLDRTRVFVGRFTVPPTIPAARLYVDGERGAVSPQWPAAEGEIYLGVGVHEISVRDEAGHATSARVVVRGSEQQALDIDLDALVPGVADAERAHEATLPRRDTNSTSPSEQERGGSGTGAWILLGSGVALAGAGVALFVVGLNDIAKVEDAPPNTEWSTLEAANDRAPVFTGVGMTLMGVGMVAIVSGLVWRIATLGGGSSEDVALSVGPGSVQLRGSW